MDLVRWELVGALALACPLRMGGAVVRAAPHTRL